MLAILVVVVGLYQGDPHVVAIRDFTELQTPSSFYALEFFAGWCGHCQAFAPIWKATAARGCGAVPHLAFGAVDCVADFLLCQEMRIASFPTLRIFGPGVVKAGISVKDCEHGCETEVQVLSAILHSLPPHAPRVLRTLSVRSLLELSRVHGCETNNSRTGTQLTISSFRFVSPPLSLMQPVPLQDLASAVVYGLQRELLRVPLGEPDSSRRLAFNAWLKALSVFMPGELNRQALHKLALRSFKRSSLDADGWESLLKSVEQPLLPQGEPAGGIAWKMCRGSTPDARGYPCGLWVLFHSMLQHATDADAAFALDAIRNYVRYFFGCADCTAHFLSLVQSPKDPMPDLSASGVGSADEARLWLWRAHNSVNARLNASGTAAVLQLGLLKQQWPTRELCSACHMRDRRWRREEVLRFLRHSYCQQNSACAGESSSSVEATMSSDVFGEVETAGIAVEATVMSAVTFVLLLSCCCYRRSCDRRTQRDRARTQLLRPVNRVHSRAMGGCRSKAICSYHASFAQDSSDNE
mmetsp:Transcript_28903/g.47952  ORF Transcript_28903/g.47952 Transcript_28903/m.47952 type:complete len:525 (+) Transcript_28903:172-1746(+)